MTNTRRGFTMIELIFVIVIIGILAAVAIPKLAGSRDEAIAANCIHNAGQLMSEITTKYTAVGYSEFIELPIEEITNVPTVEWGPDITGIIGPGINEGGIGYMCQGYFVTIIAGYSANGDYNLSVSGFTPNEIVPPASAIAQDGFRNNVLGGENHKLFTL